MAKTGRNAPCPCGSGKKYKKCCLAKDQAEERKVSRTPEFRFASEKEARLRKTIHPDVFCEEDLIDDYSNAIVDLINDGDLDGAEIACKELEEKFPEFIDCPIRRATLCEARGEFEQAIEYYERCLEMIADDPEVWSWPEDFEDLIEKLHQKIAARADSDSASNKQS